MELEPGEFQMERTNMSGDRWLELAEFDPNGQHDDEL